MTSFLTRFLCVAALIGTATVASAQSTFDGNGNLNVASRPAFNAQPQPVTIVGATAVLPVLTGTLHQTTVTCGTGNTVLLPANAARAYIFVKNPIGAANTVWINWAGATATAAAPNEDFAAAGSKTWSGPTTGFVPTAAINCIATAGAQAVELEWY